MFEVSWEMWLSASPREGRRDATTRINANKRQHYMIRAFFVPISFWRSTLSLGFFSIRVVGGSLECQPNVLIANRLFADDKERGSWVVEEGCLPWHPYSRRQSRSRFCVCPEETKSTKWSSHGTILQDSRSVVFLLTWCWSFQNITCDVNLRDIYIIYII